MESQTCSRKSKLEKWRGSHGGGNVRKKGVAVDSSAVRGEHMLWTGPWDTNILWGVGRVGRGEARLQGLKGVGVGGKRKLRSLVMKQLCHGKRESFHSLLNCQNVLEHLEHLVGLAAM